MPVTEVPAKQVAGGSKIVLDEARRKNLRSNLQ